MKFLIPILCLLASCSASHKVKTSTRKSVDSTVTTTRDTAHVSHEETTTSNLQAQDVHIRIDYNQQLTGGQCAEPGKDPARRSEAGEDWK
jgi:hypothetical protein